MPVIKTMRKTMRKTINKKKSKRNNSSKSKNSVKCKKAKLDLLNCLDTKCHEENKMMKQSIKRNKPKLVNFVKCNKTKCKNSKKPGRCLITKCEKEFKALSENKLITEKFGKCVKKNCFKESINILVCAKNK
jgi:hypothetical protein